MQQNRSYTVIVSLFFLFVTISGFQPSPAVAQNTSGIVTETMNSAGYTYALVDSGAGQTWIAIPETTIVKGAKITYKPGMVMKNFSSKTLNRTFDSIVFSPGLGENDKPFHGKATDDSFAAAISAEESKSATPVPALEQSGGSSGAITPFQEITVTKSVAANGYTIEEIFAQAKKLNGQKISLHGFVTKISANIMGRNWVHLQDGTGNPMQNTHDIVVTTSEMPELNTEITVEGVLAAEKDFGAGYKYAAIIEQTTIAK